MADAELVTRKTLEHSLTTQYTAQSKTKIESIIVDNFVGERPCVAIFKDGKPRQSCSVGVVVSPGCSVAIDEFAGVVLEPGQSISGVAGASHTLSVSIFGRELK